MSTTSRYSRTPIEPRIIRPAELNQYLRMSPTKVSKIRREHPELKFPKQVPVIKGYDVRDLDDWVDNLKLNDASKPNAADKDWSDSKAIRL